MPCSACSNRSHPWLLSTKRVEATQFIEVDCLQNIQWLFAKTARCEVHQMLSQHDSPCNLNRFPCLCSWNFVSLHSCLILASNSTLQSEFDLLAVSSINRQTNFRAAKQQLQEWRQQHYGYRKSEWSRMAAIVRSSPKRFTLLYQL